jgi:hypothetical protein
VSAFGAWLHGVITAPWRALRAMREPESRNGAALIFTAAGGLTVIIYAGFSLYIVREHANYAFWLGVGALFLHAIVLTGFVSLLSKRTIEANIAGNKIIIADQVQTAVRDAMPDAVRDAVTPAVTAGVAAGIAAAVPTPPVDGDDAKG